MRTLAPIVRHLLRFVAFSAIAGTVSAQTPWNTDTGVVLVAVVQLHALRANRPH